MADERYLFEFSSPQRGVALGDFVCFTLPLLFVLGVFCVSVRPHDGAGSKVAYLVMLAVLAVPAMRSLAGVLRSEQYHFSSRGIAITRRFAFLRRAEFIPRAEVADCVSESRRNTMFGKSKWVFIIRRTDGTETVARSSCGAHDSSEMVRYANSALGITPRAHGSAANDL